MKKNAILLAALTLFATTACEKHGTTSNNPHKGHSSDNISFSQTEELPAVTISKDGKITARDARIRIPLGGKTMTSGYVTLKNAGDNPVDIVSGSSDFAKLLELHTHLKADDGMMQMRKVDKLTIPAHGKLSLEPMGAHLMLFDTKEVHDAGTKIPITLVTSNGETLKFQATLVSNTDIINTKAEAKETGNAKHMDSEHMNHEDMEHMH